jgi:hypothetical protein
VADDGPARAAYEVYNVALGMPGTWARASASTQAMWRAVAAAAFAAYEGALGGRGDSAQRVPGTRLQPSGNSGAA